MTAAWYRRGADALTLSVWVQPGAPRTRVVGVQGDALKIRVAAPAVENQANARLVAFLAERFEVPRRQVSVKTGAQGRRKIVEIVGSRIDPEGLLEQT